MVKKRIIKTFTLLLALIFMGILTACGNNDNNDSEEGSNTESKEGSNDAAETELGDKKVTLATDTYVSNIGSTYIVKQLLEEEGYNVDVNETDVGIEFTGLADGSSDASLALWMPITHKSYWDEYSDELEKISVVTEEVRLALTVPSYMEDINSIEDLAENKNNIGEELEWEITGISPGAGMMEITENDVMPEYGLDEKWNLQSSSGPAMGANLKRAIDSKAPIVVTLWTPHWTFNEFDLKMLDDPKNQYGDPDNIYSMARKGFKEDSPRAYEIIKNFAWTKEQNQDVMYKISSEDMSREEAAAEFLENNPDLKEKWLGNE